MDTAALLQKIYASYRERRLADAVSLLSDDFKFRANLPYDPVDPLRPRSRAEFTLLAHKFLEEYDIISFNPGPISVTDGCAVTKSNAVFRHKRSGKTLEAAFEHAWRVVDGKACELEHRHDPEQIPDLFTPHETSGT